MAIQIHSDTGIIRYIYFNLSFKTAKGARFIEGEKRKIISAYIGGIYKSIAGTTSINKGVDSI